jgi:hypothetical protein
MPEMNDFKLEIEFHPSRRSSEHYFSTKIYVDGVMTFPDNGDCVDLLAVVDSLYAPGRYELFTCSCGVSGCAGWDNDIVVDHNGPDALWSHDSPNSRFLDKRFSRLQMHTELLRELEQVVPQLRIITKIQTPEGWKPIPPHANIDHEQSDINQIADRLYRLREYLYDKKVRYQ